jgi:RNA polymerase sigma factor (sigma-70 family)
MRRLLFRRHAPDVHAFAQRRVRSVDLADDVVSAAFEKASQGLDQLGARFGDRFRPWVFRIAANEMASLMRSSSRRQRREHLAAIRRGGPAGDAFGSDVDDPLASIEWAVDSDAVHRALAALRTTVEVSS